MNLFSIFLTITIASLPTALLYAPPPKPSNQRCDELAYFAIVNRDSAISQWLNENISRQNETTDLVLELNYLLNTCKANPNGLHRDSKQPPFILLAHYTSKETIKALALCLLAHKADPNAPGKDKWGFGTTSLAAAAENFNLPLVEVLANCDEINPFQHVCSHSSRTALDCIPLECINDSHRQTALRIAYQMECALMEAVRNGKAPKPANYRLVHHNHALCAILERYKDDPETMPIYVDYLLANGANPHDRLEHLSLTAWHYLARKSHTQRQADRLAAVLTKFKCDPNLTCRSDSSTTPLIEAVWHLNVAGVGALLAHPKTKVHARDFRDDNLTALEMVLQRATSSWYVRQLIPEEQKSAQQEIIALLQSIPEPAPDSLDSFLPNSHQTVREFCDIPRSLDDSLQCFKNGTLTEGQFITILTYWRSQDSSAPQFLRFIYQEQWSAEDQALVTNAFIRAGIALEQEYNI